jgi:predicted dehydrogenase
MKINVAIAGVGNAAYFIDKKINLLKKNSFSHLSILKNNNKFNLTSCCDVNKKKLKLIGKKFKFDSYHTSFSKMIKNENIEILIISTPTKFHIQQTLQAIKNKNIKIIICEKPFGFSYKKAKKIIDFSKKKGKILVINYQRRWDNFYKKVDRIIKTKKLGKLNCIIGHTDKALYQNSCHMLDLIVSFAGPVKKVLGFKDVLNLPRLVHSYHDYGGYIFLQHMNKTVSFIKASQDATNKKIFELDLHFANGRIKIPNDDKYIEIYKFKNSKQFKTYKELELVKTIKNKEEDRLLIFYKFIEKNYNKKFFKLPYNLYENIEPLKIINSIKNKL